MEDIFQWCKEGNALQVRVWLDEPEHDMNQGDDHGFSPLHWAAMKGYNKIVEMLLLRGARVNATNRGDDTPLHMAAAHGHREIVNMLLRQRADVNFTNEHGNSPLHYACFWNYIEIAEDLVHHGAKVAIANKYGQTALDKSKGNLAKALHDIAVESGQDLKKIKFKDQSYLGLKTRSRDATLSRHKGINIKELEMKKKIADTHSGITYIGRWQNNDIVAKILNVRDVTSRISRDFNEEFPKLRIFSHPNILPVIGCCNSPPHLIIISQLLPLGSLYNVLHEGSGGIVVDTAQALRFAIDIAKGMAFLHSLERTTPEYFLNSRHVMIDDDLTARLSMADAKFSFQEKGRIYYPAWMSPEALQKKITDRNWEASDMWSYAILLWELATREVPFADQSPMEVGMRIALEGLRISIKPGISSHMTKLINICMNEDPGKRPTFDMILPILDRMVR
ncbi:integrin-linked protein kinase [Diabrotica virgifera virgifera]|uniref:Protein kinase domain-containing protein n=1 Tax=Diabrotica virgifera virgifera TaxID=50390 RepID=A0ABM5KUE6_DIAVI|nr:integrin-linked protein kinase [Diabrotica virgifera virgifera]